MDKEFESLTSYTSKSKRNYAGLLCFVLVPGSVCGGSRLANRRPLRQCALPASAPRRRSVALPAPVPGPHASVFLPDKTKKTGKNLSFLFGGDGETRKGCAFPFASQTSDYMSACLGCANRHAWTKSSSLSQVTHQKAKETMQGFFALCCGLLALLRCPALSAAETALPIADRCASAPSLHPPPAAVGCTARAGSRRSRFGFPP